jgi:hypothetical protein
MWTPAETLLRRDRTDGRLVIVGLLGCVLALVLGGAAATSQGVLIAGTVVGLSLCATATLVYVRDPVLALIWLWLFEVFNAPISAAVGYYSAAGEAVRQGDEFLVLLLVVLTVWRVARDDVWPTSLRLVLPGAGVAILGVMSAIVHDVPLTVSVTGIWLGLKFWIMIGVTLMFPWKNSDMARVYSILTRVGLIVAAFGFLDYFTHSAISSALHTSIYKAGAGAEIIRAEAVHSIFPHPGEYSLFMSLLFALAFARFAVMRNKSDLLMALLFAFSILLSLRLKGFLSIIAVAAIVALAQGMGKNRGGVTVALVGALLLVGALSLEGSVITKQISTYASSEKSVRAQLYTVGERIAADDFPLGAGFGRFASYPSRLFYSPIYYQYGLSAVYGLSRRFPSYIDDTSWPSVIGETGYGGFAIYLGGLMLLVVAVVRRLRATASTMRWMPLAVLCAMAVLLVDSLGDPTLFDWLAVTTFAMILGPVMAVNRPLSPESMLRRDAGGHSPMDSATRLF